MTAPDRKPPISAPRANPPPPKQKNAPTQQNARRHLSSKPPWLIPLGLVGLVLLIAALGFLAYRMSPSGKRAAQQKKAEEVAKVLEESLKEWADNIEERQEEGKQKFARKLAERTIRVGETITLGQARIRTTKVEMGRLLLQGSINEKYALTDSAKMLVTFEIENISKGQVFAPFMYLSDERSKDNFGNSLQEYEPPLFGKLVGDYAYDDLKPSHKVEVMLVVDPKNEAATSYKLTVYTRVSNADDGIEPFLLKVTKGQMGDVDHESTFANLAVEKMLKGIDTAFQKNPIISELKTMKQQYEEIGDDPRLADQKRKISVALEELIDSVSTDIRGWGPKVIKLLDAQFAEQDIKESVRKQARASFLNQLDRQISDFRKAVSLK